MAEFWNPSISVKTEIVKSFWSINVKEIRDKCGVVDAKKDMQMGKEDVFNGFHTCLEVLVQTAACSNTILYHIINC